MFRKHFRSRDFMCGHFHKALIRHIVLCLTLIHYMCSPHSCAKITGEKSCPRSQKKNFPFPVLYHKSPCFHWYDNHAVFCVALFVVFVCFICLFCCFVWLFSKLWSVTVVVIWMWKYLMLLLLHSYIVNFFKYNWSVGLDVC